jgi:hypothetical protein
VRPHVINAHGRSCTHSIPPHHVYNAPYNCHAHKHIQIETKIDTFGIEFRGVVVDEPTAVVRYNTAGGSTDGNVSWCGSDCSSQLVAWLGAARAARAVFDKSAVPRLMLTNQIFVERIDLMAGVDGVFTESFGDQHNEYFNAIGLIGIAMPTIVWTDPGAGPGAPDCLDSNSLVSCTPPRTYMCVLDQVYAFCTRFWFVSHLWRGSNAHHRVDVPQ